jgi:CRP-like cAMP-binding protein
MFGPLSAPVVERLAGSAEHATVEAGATIVREGDSGDRFFVIADGRTEVSVGGRAAGELGPGEAFGEIALLRDVPRTATVRATAPTELLVLRRAPFLEALTGQPRSRALASDVVEEHLTADHAAVDRP